MESKRSLMALGTTRTIVLLFFLPLILAHPPIRVQSRSILRRMPIFYGKRDSSLSQNAFPLVSEKYPMASNHLNRGQAKDRVGFFPDTEESRSKNRLSGTPNQAPYGNVDVTDDIRSLSQGRIPSMLFEKLQSYLDSKASEENAAKFFSQYKNRGEQHAEGSRIYGLGVREDFNHAAEKDNWSMSDGNSDDEGRRDWLNADMEGTDGGINLLAAREQSKDPGMIPLGSYPAGDTEQQEESGGVYTGWKI